MSQVGGNDKTAYRELSDFTRGGGRIEAILCDAV
jgi:hypothetical protein